MPRDKKKASILEFFKVYGLNAALGFGLGVGIVFFSLTILGRARLEGDVSGSPVNQSSTGIEASQASPQVSEDANSSLGYGEPPKSSRFTVLLVGMDNRPGETYLGNTDSLLVASIDPINKRMTFLSIPRDTQVELSGHDIQKINAIARVQKGLPATQKYIEGLIGYPIDGYVMANFNGFKNIVDGLGGITLTVEKNMHYDTGDSQDRYIDLKKGTQRLTGSQALQYARFRNDEMADISRTARQQAVLKAIFAEATEFKNLPKLPFVLPKVYQAVQTDLSMGQLWSLASLLHKTEGYQTLSQTLPGSFAIEQGISYWKVNSNLAKKVVSQLWLEGKTTTVFTQGGSSVSSTVVAGSSNSSNSSNSSSQLKREDLNENLGKNVEVKREKEESKTKQAPYENPSQEIQFEVIKK